jgi:uncharacterized repeat protein (TIGR01451 family)
MNNSHKLKLFCYRWALSSLVSLSLSTTAWAYTVTCCFVDINNNGVAGLTVTAGGETGTTGTDGCFTMTDVAAGTNSLTMSGNGYQSQTLSFSTVSANNKTANAGTKYAIATTNGYQVKVSVVDRETNQPLNGVIFTINGDTAQVVSNDYVLSVSQPGSYTLTATKTNYDTVSANFSVSNNSPVTQMSPLKLWGGSYQVTGRVVDGEGNPVASAQVTLSTGSSATTGADGTFTIADLEAATTFNLTATKTGYTSITRNNYSVNNNVPVRNMGDLMIRAGGYQVTGRIVDIDKNPLAGVALNLNVGNSGTTAADGTFKIMGIMNPASFTLTGTKNGYQEMVRSGSVNESYPTRHLGDVYMIANDNGYRVLGCVKDAGGNGMPSVEITIAGKTAYTNNDGCYHITLDNAGSFTLTAKVVADINIPNPRNTNQTLTIPQSSFHTITKSVHLSESSPIAQVSPGIFSPYIRMGLQASSNVVVENSDLVYTVTITNAGNAPFIWAEMWSEPALPNCWSFVGGTTGSPLQAVEHSTRPLPPYPAGINTPLNCNLTDDNGHTNSPYPRLGNNPKSVDFLVSYPFTGNPDARVLECKELGMLKAGASTQVQAVVHAGCSGSSSNSGSGGSGGSGGSSSGGSGGPFVLSFGAKATPFVLKFNADGTPQCLNGCNNTGNQTSSTTVLPKPLPKLNVVLNSATSQVRLGENQLLSYTLTVSNQATDKTVSTGAVLNIPVPAEMTVNTITIDEQHGQCNVLGSNISCQFNDIPSGTQIPVALEFTPSKVDVGSVGAELTSNETQTPQTVALNYTVSRELTECEKNPTCACNPALCPAPPIPPEPQANVAIVIDDTGSMSEEIGGLRNGLNNFMIYLEGREAKPVIQLVTYKDNYTPRVTTDNLKQLRDSYVNRLTASGGDDCPENAGGALSWVLNNTAVNKLQDGGRILLITDASPHDNTDIDKLISQLLTRSINLDVLLSDNSCLADGAELDAIQEFSKMANETGGIFLPSFKINDPDDASASRHYENTVLTILHSSINPTIIAASTNTMPAGSTGEVKFTAANTNFNESSEPMYTLSIINTKRRRDGKENAIVVNKVTVLSATELLVNMTIPDNISLGFYNMIVETQLGEFTERAEGWETLEITAPSEDAEILTITPTSTLQDSEIEVTVYATNTHFNAGSQLSFGDPGILVKQTRIQSNTSLTAMVEVSAQAKLGLHDVTVMTGNETASSAESKFIVMAESKSARIKSLSANRGVRGGLLKFDIVGKNTHFEAGVTELRLLKGLTLMSFEVTSPTEASAVVLVDPDAPLGFQDVIMVTEDEVAVKLNGFEVSERGPHGVEGYALDQVGEPVANVYVSLKGQGIFTDATGYFRMTGLTAGDYTLTGESVGYHFTAQTFTVGQPPAEMANVVLEASSAIAVKIKPDDWHPAKQGGKVGYTVTVTNMGTETATGVVLTDILPANTSLASIEGGNCQVNTASCELRDLSPNQQATVKLTINNTQTQTLINTVTVTSNEYPPATVKHWKQVMPYLSVTVTGTPEQVAPNGILRYAVEVDLSPYSPSPANDVKLVTRLPEGVELQTIDTEYGQCEFDNLLTIICDLVDLSVESAEAVSHISVNIEVKLIDPGLLLLTHEAKVSANEHQAHQDRERTEIFIPAEYQMDMALVVDVTDSMQAEMNGVKNALQTFVGKLDDSQFPLSALIIFRDEVTVTAVTKDMQILIDAIGDMEASGGGTCSEASAEALEIAIRHVKPEGIIVLVTDASPYDDADLVAISEGLKKKAIKFNPFVTGDCSNQESWNALPNQP